jgi:hypothetical protein
LNYACPTHSEQIGRIHPRRFDRPPPHTGAGLEDKENDRAGLTREPLVNGELSPPPHAVTVGKFNSGLLEGLEDRTAHNGQGGAFAVLEIAHGPKGDADPFGEIALRPFEQSARGAALSRGYFHRPCVSGDGRKGNHSTTILPLLGNISHNMIVQTVRGAGCRDEDATDPDSAVSENSAGRG